MGRLKMILLMLCIVSPSQVISQENECGDDWSQDPDTGNCYRIWPLDLSWEEADKTCRALDARLASVQSQEENEYIQGLLIQIHAIDPNIGKVGFWSGGKEQYNEYYSQYFWSDRSPFNYTDWAPGEPPYRRPSWFYDSLYDDGYGYGGYRSGGGGGGGRRDRLRDIEPRRCIAWSKVDFWQWAAFYCTLQLPSVCKKTVNKESESASLESSGMKKNCPQGWHQDFTSGSCFRLLDECLSFDSAKQKCSETNNAELATIRSDSEESFVNGLAEQAFSSNSSVGAYGFWIGGKAERIGRRVKWLWAHDKSQVTYTDWAYRRTPAYLGRCIQLGRYGPFGDWKWYSQSCLAGMQAICKIPNGGK